MKKILITGSNGLLGQKLVKLFLGKKDYEIFAVARGENRLKNKSSYTYYSIDIIEHDKLINLINEIQPHYIIHTAAMTNVDACELKQKECDIINVDVVKTLASICKNNNIHLIQLSTDFIFDGEKGTFYTEEDKPNPISYYGLSKLKSEKIILKSDIKYTIIRTILVYGMVDNNDRSNIVLWVKNSIEDKKQINVVTDQFRMPTFVEDLAESCFLAVKNDVIGIYNVSSNELLSIFDIAIEVANTFNLDKSYIKPIATSSLNLPAKRPPKTGFDLNKSISQLKLPSYSFAERLQVFKNQLAS
ncbi:MAG: sugar nucleotide-binding protein [Flavobacteriaceae bacterium]|nr:sugar nucleotide-binding protein [Flavobacteriaceae bacterium]